MNDYDDLFDKQNEVKQEVIYEKATVSSDSFDDFSDRQQKVRKSLFMLALYLVVQYAVVMLSFAITNNVYAYLKDAVQEVDQSTEITFVVSDNYLPDSTEINELYPYLIEFDGALTNNYDKTIPRLTVNIYLLDANQKRVGSQTLIIDDFLADETYTIDISGTFENSPVDLEVEIQASRPSIFNAIDFLVFSLILLVIFFFIDKIDLKKNWEAIKREPRKYIAQMFYGFLMMFAANFIANMILMLLGTAETSNNEVAIRSMFNANPLNLGILFMSIGIMVPIVEEIIYRKVVFTFLEKHLKFKITIVVSALIFAFMHIQGDYIQMIPYTAMGIVLGYVYYKSDRNVLVSSGVHMLNNLYSWIMYVLMIYGIISI